MQLLLGLAVSNLGHQESALRVLGKAQRTYARQLGADSREALRAEFHMADCHRLGGDIPRATEWHEDVRRRRAAAFGDRDSETLVSMNNLAICHRVAGKPELAFPLYRTVLEVYSEDRGEDHPSTLSVANNLGVAYSATGQYRLARPLLERVLDGRLKRLTADHIDVLTTANNLGECLRRMGEYDPARRVFEDARHLGVKRHGVDAPLVVSVTYHLGLCHLDAAQPELALPLLADAYQRRKLRHGAGHAETLNVLSDLIQARALLKNNETVSLCNELVTRKRETLTDEPRDAGLLVWVGRQLLISGHPAAAEVHLREALTLLEKQSPAAWGVSQARSMLGESLLELKKYDEAEPLLKQGYEGLKTKAVDIPGIVRRARLEEALDRLVRWAQQTRNIEMAQQLEAERATLPREQLPPPRKAD
jgi:tetratricopeptide (TPR) repeat protein